MSYGKIAGPLDVASAGALYSFEIAVADMIMVNSPRYSIGMVPDRLTHLSYTDFGLYGITTDTCVPSPPYRFLDSLVGLASCFKICS